MPRLVCQNDTHSRRKGASYDSVALENSDFDSVIGRWKLNVERWEFGGAPSAAANLCLRLTSRRRNLTVRGTVIGQDNVAACSRCPIPLVQPSTLGFSLSGRPPPVDGRSGAGGRTLVFVL